jgi:hypothetical protein
MMVSYFLIHMKINGMDTAEKQIDHNLDHLYTRDYEISIRLKGE